MKPKSIVILGGYGNTGIELAKILIEKTESHITIAGRSLENARKATEFLDELFQTDRLIPAFADASDKSSLLSLLKAKDLLVVCSSTSKFTETVAEAALESGTDYYDIHFSNDNYKILESFKDQIIDKGRCFITEGGFHPGLPALLVHFVAKDLDELHEAIIGSVIKIDWKSHPMVRATSKEFLQEMMDMKMSYFDQGEWKKARMMGMKDMINMDFGDKFGKQTTVPMFLNEMKRIPDEYPSLNKTGFYVGGFNWFMDWIFLPVASIVIKLIPKRSLNTLAKIMEWGLEKYCKPPFGTLLKLEAIGIQNGKKKQVEITIDHEDGYYFTAAPVASCIGQYLTGEIRRPGLWIQAHLSDPTRMIKDLEEMGIGVKIKTILNQ